MRLLLLAALTVVFSSCHVSRFVTRNFAGITDHKIFPYTEITPAATVTPLPTSRSAPLDTLKLTVNGKPFRLTDYLDDATSTVAFLVVRGDSILYERYFDGYDQDRIATVFSVSKSVTSLLAGIAVDEGEIASVDDPITKYLPELKDGAPEFQRLTIEHLLDMRSGLDYTESYYNPFGNMAKLYYGTNQLKKLSKLTFAHEPGTHRHYQSATTALLGLVVERATGTGLGEYLEAKVWQPMGMENRATYSLDDKRNRAAKGYSGLNATARDLARIGMLYARGGEWNGRQIVSRDWVERSTTPNPDNNYYQYQWYSDYLPAKDEQGEVKYFPSEAAAKEYLDAEGMPHARIRKSGSRAGQYYLSAPTGGFYALGIMNQHIYVNGDIVIVRQGRKWDDGYRSLFRAIVSGLNKREDRRVGR